MNPNIRRPDESQADYRARRKAEAKVEKQRRPRVLWDVTRRGTYVRNAHGELR